MEKYELANPSDRIFFEADCDNTACMCAWMLSTAYGAVRLSDGKSLGILKFQADPDAIIKEYFGDVEKYIAQHLSELADCFDSFKYQGKQSSMSPIVDHAKLKAKTMRDEIRIIKEHS